jgi:hypothetical protein
VIVIPKKKKVGCHVWDSGGIPLGSLRNEGLKASFVRRGKEIWLWFCERGG